MPHSLPLPPPGFDALPVEAQIDHVQSLWDRVAATAGQVPLQEWQQPLAVRHVLDGPATKGDNVTHEGDLHP